MSYYQHQTGSAVPWGRRAEGTLFAGAPNIYASWGAGGGATLPPVGMQIGQTPDVYAAWGAGAGARVPPMGVQIGQTPNIYAAWGAGGGARVPPVGVQIGQTPNIFAAWGAGGGARVPPFSARLGQAAPTGDGAAIGYTLASLIGAALGGGIIGFMSSGEREGAWTGAKFASGLTAFSDTWLFVREDNPGGALMTLVIGLGLLGAAFYDFSQRLRLQGAYE